MEKLFTFKEYFDLINESPDNIYSELNGNKVILKFDSILAAPFGFINKEVYFENKKTKTPFFLNTDVKSELMVGKRKETHFSLLKDLIKKLKTGSITAKDNYENINVKVDLSNEEQKREIIEDPRYSFPLNSHKIFDPCGRIWTNAQINNTPHTIISFWPNTIPLTTNHIHEILKAVNVTSPDNVYIENPLKENNLLTIKDFNNIIDDINGERKTTNYKELAHLAAGFGGAFKPKTGFGSRKEREKSKQAGFNTVAQYKNVRYPYKEQYIPSQNIS